jgi:hypothetical protein
MMTVVDTTLLARFVDIILLLPMGSNKPQCPSLLSCAENFFFCYKRQCPSRLSCADISFVVQNNGARHV